MVSGPADCRAEPDGDDDAPAWRRHWRQSRGAHKNSDQVLLILEGELSGEVDDDRSRLKKGDVIVIPAGVKHRFVNCGDTPAVTFNVYSPPAYAAGSKG